VSGYVALICARGGSKGVPGKNIRPLAGKPLIGHAVEQAVAVAAIGRVLVSTDSPEIAAVARDHGADVPFLRPAELARDDSPEWPVWQHALRFLRAEGGADPAGLVVVPVTAPLRTPGDIERCIAEYERGGADVVITVTDARRSPWFNMVTLDAEGSARLVLSDGAGPARRQDAPAVYDMSTVAYVARPAFVLAAARLFDGAVRAVRVPPERALDIDTALDFRIAECLMRAEARAP
jgi:CMP-N-acetylneuraminic acid synthetase